MSTEPFTAPQDGALGARFQDVSGFGLDVIPYDALDYLSKTASCCWNRCKVNIVLANVFIHYAQQLTLDVGN